MYHIQLPVFREKHHTLESVKGDLFLTWLYALDKGWKDDTELAVIAELSDSLKEFCSRYYMAIEG